MRKTIPFFFGLCCLLAAHSVWAQAPIPNLTSPVVDTTGTLLARDFHLLSSQAMRLQQEKGSQLQILMISSTEPEEIAQYSQRVFERWKLGREKADDGVLLVIAKEDRMVRIHVGYGLEGVIPDIVANRIISEYIVPKFRGGDYSGGVIDGARALEEVIRGAELSPPSAQERQELEDIFFLTAGFTFAVVCLFGLNFLLLASLLSAYASKKKKALSGEKTGGEKTEDGEKTEKVAEDTTGSTAHALNDESSASAYNNYGNSNQLSFPLREIRVVWKKAALLQAAIGGTGILLAILALGGVSYISTIIFLFVFFMIEIFVLAIQLRKFSGGTGGAGGNRGGPGSGGTRVGIHFNFGGSRSGGSRSSGARSGGGWSGGGGRSGGGGASRRW